MKVCHQCQATYQDHVDFCFNDGEVLVPANADVAFGPAIAEEMLDDTAVPTEALPRRPADMPVVAVEEDDEDDMLDLFADPSEEPELTQNLKRADLPPDPTVAGVDLTGPEAPWASDFPIRQPTVASEAETEIDDESIEDDPTPLAGAPQAVTVVEGGLSPDAPTPPPAPSPAAMGPAPFESAPPPGEPDPSEPEHTAVGPPPLTGALDEVGIGGPPPAEEDEDEGIEHATVGEPPPPRPVDPEVTEVRGPPPVPNLGSNSALEPDAPTDTTEPRLGSAPGALAGLGRRPLKSTPAPVSTVQPVSEHAIPPPGRNRTPPPPRPTPDPNRPGVMVSSDQAGLVVVGLGLTAVAMLAIVVLGILLLTNCSRLFAAPEPVEEVIEGAPAVGVKPVVRRSKRSTPAPAPTFRGSMAGDTDAPARDVPLAARLRSDPLDDGLVAVYFPTNPPDSDVIIDGRTYGAPGPVQLRAGETFIYEIARDGYEPWEDTIVVPTNQGEMWASSTAIALRPEAGAAPARARSEPLSFSPMVWVRDDLEGCGLLIDGQPVRASDVVGSEPTLPMKLQALTLGSHEFQVVGAEANCAGRSTETIDYDGSQQVTLSAP